MFKASVLLNSADKVKGFQAGLFDCDCDADLRSGRYIIDARSIMGIFSLDLSKPLEFISNTDNPTIIKQLEDIAAGYPV